MTAIKNTVNKIFFYIGLACVIWFSSKLHSYATDTNTQHRVKPASLSELKAQRDTNNSWAVLVSFALIGGVVLYHIRIKPKRARVVVQREQPKEVEAPEPVAVEGNEEDHITDIRMDYGKHLGVNELAELIASTPMYSRLHEFIIEKYKDDWNYHQIKLIENTLKETGSKHLVKSKILNLYKTWTRHPDRDEFAPRGFFKKPTSSPTAKT